MNRTNSIPIYTEIDGEKVSHFLFSEFKNPLGWVIVHPQVPWALEHIRADLNNRYAPDEIIIIITCTTRTPQQNEALAARLGWTDEGGLVSRNSYHLVQHGGIAVDFISRNITRKQIVSPSEVAEIADLYFDWVKPYDDGHVHGDFRYSEI